MDRFKFNGQILDYDYFDKDFICRLKRDVVVVVIRKVVDMSPSRVVPTVHVASQRIRQLRKC